MIDDFYKQIEILEQLIEDKVGVILVDTDEDTIEVKGKNGTIHTYTFESFFKMYEVVLREEKINRILHIIKNNPKCIEP